MWQALRSSLRTGHNSLACPHLGSRGALCVTSHLIRLLAIEQHITFQSDMVHTRIHRLQSESKRKSTGQVHEICSQVYQHQRLRTYQPKPTHSSNKLGVLETAQVRHQPGTWLVTSSHGPHSVRTRASQHSALKLCTLIAGAVSSQTCPTQSPSRTHGRVVKAHTLRVYAVE